MASPTGRGRRVSKLEGCRCSLEVQLTEYYVTESPENEPIRLVTGPLKMFLLAPA